MSGRQQGRLIDLFVAGATARAAAEIVGVNRNTARVFHHRRVNHRKVFVTKRRHHINGIENFWNQAKRHLCRFNGITPNNFYWFLKECEWRFNSGNHQQLLKQLKSWYKSTKH